MFLSKAEKIMKLRFQYVRKIYELRQL